MNRYSPTDFDKDSNMSLMPAGGFDLIN